MPTFPSLVSHLAIVPTAQQDDWVWEDSNIYHQSFKAESKTSPTTAPWWAPAHAGVGNEGKQVQAEFNKVFKPMLSSGSHRSSQLHKPYPVPIDRLIHTYASAPSHKQQEVLNLCLRWRHVQSNPYWDDVGCESPSNMALLRLHHIVSVVNDSQLHKVLFKNHGTISSKTHGSIWQLEFSLRRYNYKQQSSYL